jgi:hypothetical protein
MLTVEIITMVFRNTTVSVKQHLHRLIFRFAKQSLHSQEKYQQYSLLLMNMSEINKYIRPNKYMEYFIHRKKRVY